MQKQKFHRITIIIYSICICINSHKCDSLRFELESASSKCIGEEIKHGAMVVGQYNVINQLEGHPLPESHRITARVTAPNGNCYHHEHVVETGTFAFTAGLTGDYVTCFWAQYHNPPIKIPIEFEWRTGVNARDWYNIARKGQIDLLDVELRRLQDTVRSIHDEMFYLREREEEMQKLNLSTKSKMAVFSLFSIVVVASVASLQLWHLKAYFERKKLI